MTTSDPSARTRPSPGVARRVEHVPIEWIKPNPFQPRTPRDDEESKRADAALREDMRLHGFRGAVQVRRDPLNPQGAFELVAGHRRLESWKSLGNRDIPAQVIEHDDKQMRMAALSENLVREDLSPWDEAVALQALREDGWTFRQLAERLGKSVGWVQNRLRLLRLDAEPLREAAREQPELLTALTLLALFEPQDQERLFQMVRSGEYDTEDLKTLLAARKARLRQLDASVTEEGGTVHDVRNGARPGQPQAREAGGRFGASQGPPPVRIADDERLLRLVKDARAEGRQEFAQAIAEAATRPPVREHPADHPEAATLGLAVEPSVETWEDLEREAGEPTEADARAAGEPASNLDARQPAYRSALRPEDRWVNPNPGGRSAEENNALVLRTWLGALNALRTNIQERLTLDRLTDDERQQWRRSHEEVNELLTSIWGHA